MMNFSVAIRRDEPVKFNLQSHADSSALNPKELMLYSAALCAAYTLEYYLKRARVQVKGFEIAVSGTLSTDTLRAEAYYTDFKVRYRIECTSSEDESAVSDAVLKTQEEGCGLMYMLRKIAPVACEVDIVVK